MNSGRNGKRAYQAEKAPTLDLALNTIHKKGGKAFRGGPWTPRCQTLNIALFLLVSLDARICIIRHDAAL